LYPFSLSNSSFSLSMSTSTKLTSGNASGGFEEAPIVPTPSGALPVGVRSEEPSQQGPQIPLRTFEPSSANSQNLTLEMPSQLLVAPKIAMRSVPDQVRMTQPSAVGNPLDSSRSDVVSLAAVLPPLVLVAASVAVGLVTAGASRQGVHDRARPLTRVFLLWLLGGLGGAHRFYCGHRRSGWVYVLTLGGCGVGWLMDLGRLRSLAESSAMASVSPDFAPVAIFSQVREESREALGPSIRLAAPAVRGSAVRLPISGTGLGRVAPAPMDGTPVPMDGTLRPAPAVLPPAPVFAPLLHENAGSWLVEGDERDQADPADYFTPPSRRQLDLAWATPMPQSPPVQALAS
jgi:hypothetical protein